MEKGQIVKLEDNKEYMVVNKISLHGISYLYLMTTTKPIDILVATESVASGKTLLKEVKDNDELDYALSQLVQEKDDD